MNQGNYVSQRALLPSRYPTQGFSGLILVLLVNLGLGFQKLSISFILNKVYLTHFNPNLSRKWLMTINIFWSWLDLDLSWSSSLTGLWLEENRWRNKYFSKLSMIPPAVHFVRFKSSSWHQVYSKLLILGSFQRSKLWSAAAVSQWEFGSNDFLCAALQ